MSKTVVFDFDGVIHSYTSGWCGVSEIPDPPVAGIKDAIGEIREAGYRVVVVSTRCAEPAGEQAVIDWLKRQKISVDGVSGTKPPAVCYRDDRAICFDGNAEALIGKIREFKPWNRKEATP